MGRNRHHVWWPRKDYKSEVEKKFRNLPCNILWIDEMAHRLLHIYTEPPRKPKVSDMWQAINLHKKGLCSCNR